MSKTLRIKLDNPYFTGSHVTASGWVLLRAYMRSYKSSKCPICFPPISRVVSACEWLVPIGVPVFEIPTGKEGDRVVTQGRWWNHGFQESRYCGMYAGRRYQNTSKSLIWAPCVEDQQDCMGPVSGVEICGVNDTACTIQQVAACKNPNKSKGRGRDDIKGGQAKPSYESRAYHGNLHIECVHSHGPGYWQASVGNEIAPLTESRCNCAVVYEVMNSSNIKCEISANH